MKNVKRKPLVHFSSLYSCTVCGFTVSSNIKDAANCCKERKIADCQPGQIAQQKAHDWELGIERNKIELEAKRKDIQDEDFFLENEEN